MVVIVHCDSLSNSHSLGRSTASCGSYMCRSAWGPLLPFNTSKECNDAGWNSSDSASGVDRCSYPSSVVGGLTTCGDRARARYEGCLGDIVGNCGSCVDS